MENVVKFLTSSFPLASEAMAFGMALEAAMAVRNGPNKDKNLHWFHAFFLSVVAAYTGGALVPLAIGKPSLILANDLNMASCILSFVLVNYIPGGYMLCSTLPVMVVMVSFSQLFRTTGVYGFTTAAFQKFEGSPSSYYPIPVFGPILYATILGNGGGFLLKGLEGHVKNGVPWPVQNGLFCATFYLFYVLDEAGPIGEFLRTVFPAHEYLGMDKVTFGKVFVGAFMQITGILRMKPFLGPSFTPFSTAIVSPFMDSSTWAVGKEDSIYAAQQAQKAKEEKQSHPPNQGKKSKGKGKGKKGKKGGQKDKDL